MLVKLASCQSGLLMVVDSGGKVLDSLRVGHAAAGHARDGTEPALLARHAPQGDCVFRSLTPCHTLVQKCLGDAPPPLVHSVVGRVRCPQGLDLVMVAGWRAEALGEDEAEMLARAGDTLRDTFSGAFASPACADSPAPQAGFDLFNSVVSPVFRVDERMGVVSMNDAARREIADGTVLREVGGRLVSVSGCGHEELRNAVRRALRDVASEGRRTSIVPLATDVGLPRFAIIAPCPVQEAPSTAVIVLPAVDGDEGARRLASLYGLTQAEQKVVRLVLTGVTPVNIAARLNLTEATVRTYLKRIMLKLGINRRSEFFLLYILTMSPFRLTPEPDARHEADLGGLRRAEG